MPVTKQATSRMPSLAPAGHDDGRPHGGGRDPLSLVPTVREHVGASIRCSR